MKKRLFKYLSVGFIGLVVVISSSISLSVVWGSQKFSFTALNMALPLLGAVYGLGQSLVLTSLFFAGKLAFIGAPLTYGIPSLCATASMAVNTKKTRFKMLNFALHVLLPIICMMLFTLHPVGRNAFVYSWYWLIPVGIYVAQPSSFFFTALSSTFIAHAVGSIIWLYTVPMEAAQWIGLLPIVAVERLVFASGSTLMYAVLKKCIQYREKTEASWLKSLTFLLNRKTVCNQCHTQQACSISSNH